MLRNIVHLGLGQVATTLLAVLLSAAIARTLGAAEFGLLYLVSTVGTFAYVFVDWGHPAYVTREVARHPERAGELTGTVMATRVCRQYRLSSIFFSRRPLRLCCRGRAHRARPLSRVMPREWLAGEGGVGGRSQGVLPDGR